MFIATDTWKTTYPDAHAGVLAMAGVANPEHSEVLDRRKIELEVTLRSRFAGQDRAALAVLPVVQAYTAYYSRFRKTYHVLLQLDSVALRGRSIPRVAALVEAMFMAELQNQLLTAGHDLAAIQGSVRLGVARGDERYTLLNNKEQVLTAGDMFMADDQGVTSSVLYGPDYRTRITPATQRILFTVYAPAGIAQDAVYGHLQDIQGLVTLVAPDAVTEEMAVYPIA